MTVLYPNILYNEVCHKGITMYSDHIEECILCYKGTILQRNYRKMTIVWSFSYNSYVKFYGKNIGSHDMTVLYPNMFLYNEVCCKGIVMYCYYIEECIFVIKGQFF